MRFVFFALALSMLVGCESLRKLNTTENVRDFEQWVAEKNSEERLTAEYGAVIPPPNSNRGG